MRGSLIGGVCALLLAGGGLALQPRHAATAADLGAAPEGGLPPLVRVEPLPARPDAGTPAEPASSPLEHLDLTRISDSNGALTAPAGGATAKLTLDPPLQRAAIAMMAAHHVLQAAVVLMEVATGRLLVYASHAEEGPARDLCVEASAPSASVFKIVTAAALVEDAHLGASTSECYAGGGEQRIEPADLVEDARRDKWCTTLGAALGRSVNTVFARLARDHLAPQELESMAHRFGYGTALPFDVPVQPSEVHVPSEPLELARTAAGFANTTLSPLLAVEMSAIVARGGEAVRPEIVDEVVRPGGAVWTPEKKPARRAVDAGTAEELATMMRRTVSEGTSRRSFHDGRGLPFLPGVTVAGKTGTLSDRTGQRHYTWFTGFAPDRPSHDWPQVAVAVLAVNGPIWQVKANVLARDVLRLYFASHGAPGVSRPLFEARASRARP